MFLDEVFVLKLLTVNTFTPSSIAAGKVTSLKHEIGNYTMELTILVSESLLMSTERSEVL